MTYSRKYLEQVRSRQQDKTVIQHLLNTFHSGQPLSLAEEEYICGIMSLLRTGTGLFAYNIAQLPGCANYRFRRLYLIYAYDLDGIHEVRDYSGPIPQSQKIVDVAFLNAEFTSWLPQVTGANNANVLMGHLIIETAYQIKILDKHCRIHNCPIQQKTYLYKSIILHSKYIHLLVKEFSQEYGHRTVLDLHEHRILIDEFSFVHTLFRHFAGGVKDYETQRSHHMDRTILFKELPLLMIKFIRCFARNCSKKEFNGYSIDLVYRKKKYTLWFGPFSAGNPSISYLRLKTFYPVERRNALKRIQGLKKVKITSKLTFLVEH